MKLSLTVCRRSLLTIAVLLIVVALMVAVTVIPQVKAEFLRGDTPQNAVIAFWVNIILTVLVAIVIWLVAKRTRGRNFIQLFALGLVAFIILILGWALGDAGEAYSGHGPAMHTASIILFIGCGINLLVVLSLIITMLFFPKRA
jgi:phosphoglycerol transferase MdoB-like AlkP superfamily enzyme